MEKGSFQELSQVPIPSQLPDRPDLSSLPSEVLRSGAVESLISQNDDLMARLSVSLRRISLLEEKLHNYDKVHHQVKFHYDNLKDQVLLLKEKSKLATDKKEATEEQLKSLKEQVKVLEINYADIYTSSKDKEQDFHSKLNQLGRRLQRFLRYRKHIQRASRQVKRHYADLLEENRVQKQQLIDKTVSLEGKVSKEQFTQRELAKKLSESTQYIQNQKREFEDNQKRLTEGYEGQILQRDRELQELRKLNTSLERRCEEIDKLYDENVKLQNQIIFSQRKQDELKTQKETELSQLQQNLSHFRSESKSKTLKIDSLTKEMGEIKTENSRLKENQQKLEDQVESLQCLWKDNQSQLEEQQEKNTALQKLNQQLSTSMNELRQEVKKLKVQLDEAQMQALEQVKGIKTSLKAHKSLDPASTPVKSLSEPQIQKQNSSQLKANKVSTKENEDEDFHPELMNKIDSLIAEIQSGFTGK